MDRSFDSVYFYLFFVFFILLLFGGIIKGDAVICHNLRNLSQLGFLKILITIITIPAFSVIYQCNYECVLR